MGDDKTTPIIKVDDQLGIVFGFGAISEMTHTGGEIIKYYDSDNQHISSDTILKASSAFMETGRVNNDNHTEKDVGIVVHSFPLTPEIAKAMGIQSHYYGWMVGIKPDSATLAKYKSGEYTGFSIEGKAAYVDEEEG